MPCTPSRIEKDLLRVVGLRVRYIVSRVPRELRQDMKMATWRAMGCYGKTSGGAFNIVECSDVDMSGLDVCSQEYAL